MLSRRIITVTPQINSKLGSLGRIKAALPPESFRIAVQAMAEEFESVAQQIEDAQTNDRDDILKHYKGWTTQEFNEYAERLRKLARMIAE